MIVIATLLDLLIGDPKGFPHPIIYIGKLISFYEKFFYRFKNKKIAGFVFTFCVLGTVGIIIWLIIKICLFNSVLLFIVNTFILYTSLSCKSLKVESRKVIEALRNNDLILARKYLSYIVGRDTENLNKEQILKAVIETVAENIIDGIIAVFFFMIIGYFFNISAILVYLYKTVSTLDSMVGYKNEKYIKFGYTSAKLDDILNFIPARMGSIILLFSGFILGYNIKEGFRIFKRDRKNHSSPNSAHSESVIAGLLGVRLGGGNYYFGKYIIKPYIGDETRQAQIEDLKKVYNVLNLSVIIILSIFMLLVVIL